MTEKVLFSGAVDISYGQFYVTSKIDAGLDGGFDGQVNGLCGAAIPGHLLLVTEIKHGIVQVTVERHTDEPPLPDSWEEIVEVSFVNTCNDPVLAEWDGEGHQLQLGSGSYRVRYCACGMDAARDAEQNYDSEVIDTYLLQLWSGPAGADRILRQTEDDTQMRETAAVYAVLATGEQDTLVAALSTVHSAAAAFGGDLYRRFLADLRESFPTLSDQP